jgi:acetoacetyl-CoA reductase
MKNKVAVITGGMGGIGTAIARHFSQLGATVVVTYHKDGDHEMAKVWQNEQKNQNYQFILTHVNITDFKATEQMVKDIIQQLGRIDILVNNAGITEDTTLMKMSAEQWLKVINTNLNGVFNVTRNVLENMIKFQYGRIINISSINGQKGQFGQTNYCAAKAGIHGFTKALAQEMAKKGVTVNTVSPGYVRTPMVEKLPENILEHIIKQIPVGRLAEPEEVARVVGFLAADSSGFITGSNFSINGGQHMY